MLWWKKGDCEPWRQTKWEDVPSCGEQLRRSQRERQVPQILREYELYPDIAITVEGDFVYFALLAELEPMSHDEVSQSSHWRAAMEEELSDSH